MSVGKVYLIGAGPGDPKLITVKGRECIAKADVVVYDYLADVHLLQWAREDAELIYVGKRCKNHTMTQENINQLLVARGLQGQIVARLKGGDPLVFGRGGEEGMALHKAGVPFEFVPGVTSAIAGPAYAGIPVTQRAMATSMAIVTGHEDPTKPVSGVHWQGLATAVDTVTFVMGVTHLPIIVKQLMKYGRPANTPVALVRWGTKPIQTVVVSTLEHVVEDAQKAKMSSPAIIIVGDVVNLRDQLRWFDNKPLFGKNILVTRARSQASKLTEALLDQGAQVIEAATIRTQAIPDAEPDLWNRLDTYRYVVFTSAEGVRYFFDGLAAHHKDSRALHGMQVVAIGSATAKALTNKGIMPDVVPADYKAESVVDALTPLVEKTDTVLLIQPKVARDVIPNGLRALGVDVTVARLYETVQDTSQREVLIDALQEGAIDYVTFTSSSTVMNCLELLGEEHKALLQQVRIACIGPITAATAVEQGLEPQIISDVYTIDGLVNAIIEQATKKQ